MWIRCLNKPTLAVISPDLGLLSLPALAVVYLLGHQVYLQLRPKRYECPFCSSKKHRKISTQQVSWYRAKSPHTKAYEEQVLLQLVNSTIQDVALKILEWI